MDTYYGHVRTPADAIKLFEACRLGLLPRVQRRLSEKERQSIKSGSVFVWDEREAGMRRWTDGKSWSASRVSGSFLTYREMEGKRGGGQFVPPPARRVAGKTPDSGRGSDEDQDMDGDGPDGYRYKPDGLMKQSFSITTSTGQHLHLISYYSRQHSNAPELPQPTTDPTLRNIIPQKGMYPESTIHESQGPAVTRTPMQPSPYMQSSHHGPMRHSPHQGPPPPYPYQGSQGYAWPPSPVSTPPFPQYQGSIYNSPLPPPGSTHSSPYQHSPHHLNQLPPTSVPPQGPTVFDRPPPSLPESSLPPPPPRQMSAGTQQNLMPIYAPNPSPRVAQATLIAQQAQLAAQRIPQTPLDPRLTASQPQQLPPVQIPTQRTTTPPQSSGLSHSAANTPSSTGRPATPKATSSNIPSIASMVNAPEDEKESRSPREGSREREEAKDIPHEKLNILGEDQRAIRVLDRKFCI